MKRAPLTGGHRNPQQEDELPAIAGGVPVLARQSRPLRRGFRDSDFPNVKFVAERTISTPLSAGMSKQDVADVAVAPTCIFRYYKATA